MGVGGDEVARPNRGSVELPRTKSPVRELLAPGLGTVAAGCEVLGSGWKVNSGVVTGVGVTVVAGGGGGGTGIDVLTLVGLTKLTGGVSVVVGGGGGGGLVVG